MGLSQREFAVLLALFEGGIASQRDLAARADVSLGTANAIIGKLREAGLADAFAITEAGLEALAPYKVENAIIMAAGMSSRFVPLSYEKPKGVLRVRGEVLIERQIRQLQEAGITDITVVVGYMKEAFFYLEDAFGVKIRVNEHYAQRNNNSTLMLAREQLGNTYICSSDDYFTENVFRPYVHEAYYAASFFAGPTDEYCLTCAADGRITRVDIGGEDAWAMLGHVYFDRAFSHAFVDVLQRVYDLPETAPKLWEDIYIDHINELRMVMKPYEEGVVYEFDSLSDLVQFDHDFLDNVDCAILDNICSTLSCTRADVVDVKPIKEGLTNLSFRFTVAGQPYVYRHPGPGTDDIINRAAEAFSLSVAKDLGVDDTFVYEDSDAGWKISRFVEGCTQLDYDNPAHVERAMKLIRSVHTCGVESEWTFDVMDAARAIADMLDQRFYPSFPDFDELTCRIDRLHELARADGVPLCLCHNDFYAPNFLVRDDEMYLIDWEYSAMSDYASDLGTFICCSEYTPEQAKQVIDIYFEGEATPAQMRHCLAYVALAAYYWMVWALYKEASGDPVGEWLYLWYRYAVDYSNRALALYEGESA